jgi:hypothetical protein
VGIQIASVEAAGTCLDRVDMAFADFEEPCCEGRMHEVPYGHGACFGLVRIHIAFGLLAACWCDRVHVGMVFAVIAAAYYAACSEEERFEEEYYAEGSFGESYFAEACWG